jgi:hypothetical protein
MENGNCVAGAGDKKTTGEKTTGGVGASENRMNEAEKVRKYLKKLSTIAKGNSIEVRVPPFGAVQAVAGQRHKRGTPPNVVEMDPETFISLVEENANPEELIENGKIFVSGSEAEKVFKWISASLV